jgi:hypothetical protein
MPPEGWHVETVERYQAHLCAGTEVLLRMDIKPDKFSWRTHLRRQLKCLEPMGYTMYKNPIGYIIEKNDETCWVAKDYREAYAYLCGVLDSHPFAEKIRREYQERLQNESLARSRKR